MEVLVVLAMLSVISAATLFFSLSFYQSEALSVERRGLLMHLRYARAAAMQHSGGLPHGLTLDRDGGPEYILFAGESFALSDSQTHRTIPHGFQIEFASGTPAEIVFEPLSGQSRSVGAITLLDAYRDFASTTITITAEGAIY